MMKFKYLKEEIKNLCKLKKLKKLKRFFLQLNVYIALHYKDVTDEYIMLNNCITFIKKNKHKQTHLFFYC